MEAEKDAPKVTHKVDVVDSEADSKADIEANSEANRPVWSNKTEYIMVQVGFCMGIGIIWRFPSLCYQNGGGSFLIVYILLLFTLGSPLVFTEMALGQKVRFGVWSKLHHRLWGIGLACTLVCFLVAIYYNVFIAWSLFYLTNSFQYPLPWNQCPVLTNTSTPDPVCNLTTPSIYFWYWQTLEVTGSMKNSGGLVSNISTCLLVVWLLIILFTIQGMRVKGKILSISIVILFAILFCFLFQSYMLEGSVYGMLQLMTAQVSSIMSLQLWKQAATQVFYNMGLGFGSITILASYIKKSRNYAQDAFVMVFFNLAFCLLATQVIFSLLGFRATIYTRECSNWNSWKLSQLIKMGKLPLEAMPPSELLKKPVKAYSIWLSQLNSDLRSKILAHVSDCDLEKQLVLNIKGPDPVFVALSEAIAKVPIAPFWSVIFFLMFIFLGLSSSIAMIQGILTPLLYNFPHLQNSSLTISGTIGFLGFLSGLLFTQCSGLYFMNFFHEFAVSLPLLIVVFFENIGVVWIYGAKRFMDEMRNITGFNISVIHEYLLCYVTLLILPIFLICNLLELLLKYPTYRAWDKNSFTELILPYPIWAVILGSGLILLPILSILVGLLKGSKKPIIMPLLKDSSPELSGTSSNPSSLTHFQNQQAPSSRKTSRAF